MSYTFKNRDFFIAVLVLFLIIVYATVHRYHKATTLAQQQATQERTIQEQQVTDEVVQDVAESITGADIRLNEQQFLIVDTRSYDTYLREHIRASVHLSDFDPEEPPKALETANTIVLVTSVNQTTQPSENLVRELTPFAERILVLEGGLRSYQSAGGVIISQPDPTSFVDHSKISYVEPRDLNTRIKENAEIFIVDVRRSGNYAKGHVPGARNFPLEDLEHDFRAITGREIFVYGADEGQTFLAAVLMHDLGFTTTKTINGGFAAWEKFGYPIETE